MGLTCSTTLIWKLERCSPTEHGTEIARWGEEGKGAKKNLRPQGLPIYCSSATRCYLLVDAKMEIDVLRPGRLRFTQPGEKGLPKHQTIRHSTANITWSSWPGWMVVGNMKSWGLPPAMHSTVCLSTLVTLPGGLTHVLARPDYDPEHHCKFESIAAGKKASQSLMRQPRARSQGPRCSTRGWVP